MGACDVIRHVTGYPAAPNLHWGIKFRVDSHYIVRYRGDTNLIFRSSTVENNTVTNTKCLSNNKILLYLSVSASDQANNQSELDI